MAKRSHISPPLQHEDISLGVGEVKAKVTVFMPFSLIYFVIRRRRFFYVSPIS
jgi:hypothetical protein